MLHRDFEVVLADRPAAPGDTTAPATAATPTIQAQHLREVTLASVTGSDLDLAGIEFQIRTATGGGGFLLASGTAVAVKGSVTSKALTVPVSAAYGATLWARCRAKDFTGNPTSPTAGWSGSQSFVLARAASDDYTDNSITPPKLPPGAVTPPKLADPTVVLFNWSIAAGPNVITTIVIPHSLGKIPVQVGFELLNNSVFSETVLRQSTQVTVKLLNTSSIVQSAVNARMLLY